MTVVNKSKELYDYFEGTLFRSYLVNNDNFLESIIKESEDKDRVVLLISVPKKAVPTAVDIIEKNLNKCFLEQ